MSKSEIEAAVERATPKAALEAVAELVFAQGDQWSHLGGINSLL